jgi:tRNA pseudouridine65 synthase
VTDEVPIRYRDDHFIVVVKPGGIHVHRSEFSPDRDVLVRRVRHQIGARLFPVNRLDRATSGLVLLALSSESARALQELWHDDATVKRYWALVRGEVPATFSSDRPLTRRSDGVIQDAQTSFERLEEDRGFSLVEARLGTGRRHQVRRHLARLRHQIVGDTTYGKGGINRWLRAEYGLPRLFLHATGLRLVHPVTGETVEIEEPLPSDLAGFLERFSETLASRFNPPLGDVSAPAPPKD